MADKMYEQSLKNLKGKLEKLIPEFEEIENSWKFKASKTISSWLGISHITTNNLQKLDRATGYGKLLDKVYDYIELTFAPYNVKTSLTSENDKPVITIGDKKFDIDEKISIFLSSWFLKYIDKLIEGKENLKIKRSKDTSDLNISREFGYLKSCQESITDFVMSLKDEGNIVISDFKTLILSNMEKSDIEGLGELIPLIDNVLKPLNLKLNQNFKLVWGKHSNTIFKIPTDIFNDFYDNNFNEGYDSSVMSLIEDVDDNGTLMDDITALSGEIQNKCRKIISSVDINQLHFKFEDISIYSLMLFLYFPNNRSTLRNFKMAVKGAINHLNDKENTEDERDINPVSPERRKEDSRKNKEDFELNLKTTAHENPRFRKLLKWVLDTTQDLLKRTDMLKYFKIEYVDAYKYFLAVPKRNHTPGSLPAEIQNQMKDFNLFIIEKYSKAIMALYKYVIYNYHSDISDVDSKKLRIKFHNGETLNLGIFPINKVIDSLLKECVEGNMLYQIGEMTTSGDIAIFSKPIGMNTPGQTLNTYGFSDLPVDSNPTTVIDKDGKIIIKKNTQFMEESIVKQKSVSGGEGDKCQSANEGVNASLPLPYQINTVLTIKSGSPDIIDTSNTDIVYNGINYELLGLFMEHWETKDKEKDPKRQEILACFLSRYLQGVFDSFIFNVFTDKEFDIVAAEIGKFVAGMNDLRLEYVKNTLIDNLFIFEDKTSLSKGQYIISDEFVNHIDTVSKYIGYPKKGMSPKDAPQYKNWDANWGRPVRVSGTVESE